MNQIKFIDEIPVAYQEFSLYRGDIAVFPEQVENPGLEWTGAKINWYMWHQIVTFMKYTYDKYKSESQIRLYYNEHQDIWKPVVMPQYIDGGLTSNEIKNHQLREEIIETVNSADGWRENGTVHHHCNIGAFQSGTDFDDEATKNGLHITLGHMGASSYDIDGRVVFRRIQYPVNFSEWIEMADEEDLVTPNPILFPEEWKKYLFKKPKPKVVTTYGRGINNGIGFGKSYHTPDRYRTNTSETEDKTTKDVCPGCDGYGFDSHTYEVCELCFGEGTTPEPGSFTSQDPDTGTPVIYHLCRACQGRGVSSAGRTCYACDGIGYICNLDDDDDDDDTEDTSPDDGDTTVDTEEEDADAIRAKEELDVLDSILTVPSSYYAVNPHQYETYLEGLADLMELTRKLSRGVSYVTFSSIMGDLHALNQHPQVPYVDSIEPYFLTDYLEGVEVKKAEAKEAEAEAKAQKKSQELMLLEVKAREKPKGKVKGKKVQSKNKQKK